MNEAIEILRQLVAVDSRTSGSNLAILDTMQHLIGESGTLSPFSRPVGPQSDLANLTYEFTGGPGADERPRIVIAGHTDTVNPAAAWVDPFNLALKDGRWHGLGASDMKSGLVGMILLAHKARQTPPRHHLTLLFTADEEGDALGAQQAIRDYAYRKAWVIVPEATSNQISLGQKACLDFRITTYGTAGHAARAVNNSKNNAIYRMVRVLDALIQDETTRLDKLSDSIHGRAIQSLGTIHGGASFNVVADHVVVSGTRRLIPSQSFADEKRRLKELIHAADMNAELDIFFEGPAFATAPDAPLVRALGESIRNVTGKVSPPITQRGWTEAAYFAKWGTVAVFGPGDAETSHSATESIDPERLKDYCAVLDQLVF